MSRVNQRVLSAVKIIGIVALNRLRQKRQPNQKDDPEYQ